MCTKKIEHRRKHFSRHDPHHITAHTIHTIQYKVWDWWIWLVYVFSLKWYAWTCPARLGQMGRQARHRDKKASFLDWEGCEVLGLRTHHWSNVACRPRSSGFQRNAAAWRKGSRTFVMRSGEATFEIFWKRNEQWTKPGCLGYIGDYTTQLYRDYNKPLKGSLLNNQYNGK